MRAHSVAHTQFVVNVRVGDGGIRHNQIGCDQLEKHIGPDITGGSIAVSTAGFTASLAQSRLKKALINIVKIDFDIERCFGRSFAGKRGLFERLSPKRHNHEGMEFQHFVTLRNDLIVARPAGCVKAKIRERQSAKKP
jgi:hypothetical protein